MTVKVDGHAWVDADLTLYQRALSNLLSNALATRARQHRDDRLRGAGRCDDDRRVGYSPASRPSTSERSSSASIVSIRPGTTRRRGRAGAAIVRSIMDNHGGECGVDSDPGRRTTFWLRFPRRPVELKRPAALPT